MRPHDLIFRQIVRREGGGKLRLHAALYIPADEPVQSNRNEGEPRRDSSCLRVNSCNITLGLGCTAGSS